MGKPNFFIIGAPKCGTTSVADWLRLHPDVFIPKHKEPHYFNKDHNFNAFTSYEDYVRLFDSGCDRKAVGEASVWYLYSDVAVKNIEKVFPGSKYIVCLRNPVEMAYSLYWEQLYATNETESDFFQAWSLSDDRRVGLNVGKWCREPKHLDYKKACLLGWQVERLLTTVDKDRVLFVLMEDLINSPERVYQRMLSFLNVFYVPLHEYQPSNKFKKVRSTWLKRFVRIVGKLRKAIPIKKRLGILNFINRINKKDAVKPALGMNAEKAMKDYFSDDMDLLSTLIERDLSHWKTRVG